MRQSREKMQIALNLLEFHPGEMGGIETYVREMVTGLSLPSSGCELTIICNERAAAYFASLTPQVRQIVFTTRRRSFARSLRSFLRGVGIDLVSLAVNRQRFDLVHTPFTNVRAYQFKAPQVVTFHDLQHEYFPEFFTRRERKRRDVKFRRAARLAVRIIAISQFTKNCLVERYGVQPDSIDVVYEACNADYQPRTDAAELAAVRQRYGLYRPFLYYPAATWPHKNHAALLAALKILVERNGFDGELVLTGIASRHHDAVQNTIAEMGVTDRVRVLGYLPYEDLPYLYNLAKMLVFPSLHEGFGIPLVEAMASGCPVICANGTSIPEVVGDAGLMFNPDSHEGMAATIWTVWNNDELLHSIRNKGLRRATDFSWQYTVEATVEVYQRLCA